MYVQYLYVHLIKQIKYFCLVLWGEVIAMKKETFTYPHFFYFNIQILLLKINSMSYKKELIVTDPSKLPAEWWNYLVNPIVGYYIPRATLYKKQKT